MPDKLTPRQREVLDFIRDHARVTGRPPTHRETAAHFGWATGTGIRCHLVALERKGMIHRDSRSSRGICLVGEAAPTASVRIPLVGSVPAGLPAEAIPESGESLAIDADDYPHPEELFALHVYGDSMKGAGILEGDRLIIRRTVEASTGKIVVASIDGETTVKRLLREGRRFVLHPENPRFKDIKPQPGEEWRIEGVVVGLSRIF